MRINSLVLSGLLCSGCSQDEALPPPTVGLLDAARTGNLAQVHAHVERGEKQDVVDSDGNTAIEFAAGNDDKRMFQLLLDKGSFEALVRTEKYRRRYGPFLARNGYIAPKE